jgi:hypothetical protein
MREPVPDELMPPPFGWGLHAYALAFDDRRGARRTVKVSLWLSAQESVLQATSQGRVELELRSSEATHVRLDHPRTSGAIRLGTDMEENRFSVIEHLLGPAAFLYSSEVGEADWAATPFRSGTRYRAHDLDGGVTEVRVDEAHMPRYATTRDFAVSWTRLLPSAADLPEPPDLSGWRVESAEYNPDDPHRACAAAAEMGEEATIVRFRSTGDEFAREHALIGMGEDGHALARVTVGARPVAGDRDSVAMAPIQSGPVTIQVVGRGERSAGLANRINERLLLLGEAGAMVDERREDADSWWRRMNGVVRGAVR